MATSSKTGVQAVGLAVLCALAPATIVAEVAAATDGATGNAGAADPAMEEIIVTAQRRAQSTLEVPIAVTALDGDLLTDVGALDLKDVQYMVPGLQVTEQNGNGSDRITIRGVSPPGNNQPTVGRYFEEMPVNSEVSQFGITLPFFDIDRIEVLRGPQGTLYGEGSIGGTIRTITRKPSVDGVDGELEVTGTNVDGGGTGFTVRGAGNLPLPGDRFGIRLAGFYDDAPGYIDSPRFGDDVNVVETWALRTNLLWTPVEAFTASLMYQHLDSEAGGNQFSQADYVTDLWVFDTASSDEYDLLNLVLDMDVGFAQLTSVTGWLDRETLSTPDLTNVFVPTLNAGLGIPVEEINDIVNVLGHSNELFFQEFRLSSELPIGGFWQLGVSYRETETTVVSNAAPVEPLPVIGTAGLLFGETNSDIEAVSIYGDVTLPLGETVEVTLGGRYYEDERKSFNPLVFFFQPLTVDETVENDAFTPRGAVSWRYREGHMAYFSVAEGFRSGGAQIIDVVVLPLTYDPEELVTYELGFKGSFSRPVFQYEVIFFLNDYDNIQTFEPNPLNLQAFGNGGEAEMKGVELSLFWLPLEGLSLSGTLGYNDNEYTEPGLTHEEGDPLDYTSELTASVSGDYRWPLGSNGWSGHFRVDYQYADGYQYSLTPATEDAPGVIFFSDDVHLLNLRLGLIANRWSTYLFVDNLTNESPVIFPAAAQDREPVLQKPRSAGITLRWGF